MNDKTSKKKPETIYYNTKALSLQLACEWEDCTNISASMKDFAEHVKTHITAVTSNDDDYEEIACQWCDCLSSIKMSEFKRHVYFHAHHSKLKSIGMQTIAKGKLTTCMMDPSCRNYISELPESFTCAWGNCEFSCDQPDLFYEHVRKHSEEYPIGKDIGDVKCLCRWQGCDSTFKNRYKLQDHFRSHTQEKIIGCPTCGNIFASIPKFRVHLIRQDDSQRTYQCSHCNKCYQTEGLLRDHMRKHVSNYKCPFCDMTVPSPSHLKVHIRYRHTDDRKHQCRFCKKGFKTERDLQRHEKTFHKKELCRCPTEGCEFTSRHQFQVAKHIRIDHKGEYARYMCHICGANYARGYTLTHHLKKFHGFSWMPGHRKFKYVLHEDGAYILQTVRYESYELSQQMRQERSGKAQAEKSENSDGSSKNAAHSSADESIVADGTTGKPLDLSSPNTSSTSSVSNTGSRKLRTRKRRSQNSRTENKDAGIQSTREESRNIIDKAENVDRGFESYLEKSDTVQKSTESSYISGNNKAADSLVNKLGKSEELLISLDNCPSVNARPGKLLNERINIKAKQNSACVSSATSFVEAGKGLCSDNIATSSQQSKQCLSGTNTLIQDNHSNNDKRQTRFSGANTTVQDNHMEKYSTGKNDKRQTRLSDANTNIQDSHMEKYSTGNTDKRQTRLSGVNTTIQGNLKEDYSTCHSDKHQTSPHTPERKGDTATNTQERKIKTNQIGSAKKSKARKSLEDTINTLRNSPQKRVKMHFSTEGANNCESPIKPFEEAGDTSDSSLRTPSERNRKRKSSALQCSKEQETFCKKLKLSPKPSIRTVQPNYKAGGSEATVMGQNYLDSKTSFDVSKKSNDHSLRTGLVKEEEEEVEEDSFLGDCDDSGSEIGEENNARYRFVTEDGEVIYVETNVPSGDIALSNVPTSLQDSNRIPPGATVLACGNQLA